MRTPGTRTSRPSPPTQSNSRLGVIALGLGVVSVVLVHLGGATVAAWPSAIVLGLAAIALGVVVVARPGGHRAIPVVGIALGSIGVVLGTGAVVFSLFFFIALGAGSSLVH